MAPGVGDTRKLRSSIQLGEVAGTSSRTARDPKRASAIAQSLGGQPSWQAANGRGVLRRGRTPRDRAIIKLREFGHMTGPTDVRDVFSPAEVVELYRDSSAFLTASSVVKIAISRRLSS